MEEDLRELSEERILLERNNVSIMIFIFICSETGRAECIKKLCMPFQFYWEFNIIFFLCSFENIYMPYLGYNLGVYSVRETKGKTSLSLSINNPFKKGESSLTLQHTNMK